ncbi:helicase sen1-like [Leguminivora glycinivorella]|uniref:helicase sen1-like n=1 Tax=Leguminivora glycinivorella TaxID=1035111 RepID=UPI00200C50CC|nr:helicase sen1-like [Leguminivora glycinivorella]
MAKWKLCRQKFGTEEFHLEEDTKISIGRGYDNKITLSSIVISRNHCVIEAQKDRILITDLKSSNGTYIGGKKVLVGATLSARHNDLIGFGWTTVVSSLPSITDNDKHVYKLVNENHNENAFNRESLSNRIQYLSDSDDNLESKIASMDAEEADAKDLLLNKVQSELNKVKSLKRKSLDNVDAGSIKIKKDTVTDSKSNNQVTEAKKDENNCVKQSTNVINLLSDSDSEVTAKECKKGLHDTKKVKMDPIIEEQPKCEIKKIKMDPLVEEQPKSIVKEEVINTENEISDFEAFDVKQEYLGFDDNEPIEIEDSDIDSESEQWLMRLSQSSPGKPFIRRSSQIVAQQENTSYSQIDPIIEVDNDEDFCDDIISIPPPPTESENKISPDKKKGDIAAKNKEFFGDITDEEDILDDMISLVTPKTPIATDNRMEIMYKDVEKGEDRVDGFSAVPPKPVTENQNEVVKKAQMIEPLVQPPRRKSHYATSPEGVAKVTTTSSRSTSVKSSSSSSKRSKSSSKHSSKNQLSDALKEERRKKLREIATKDKQSDLNSSKTDISDNQSNKPKVNIKQTSSNRGAFLAEEQVAQAVVKPMARKTSPEKSHKTKSKKSETSRKSSHSREARSEDIENSKKRKEKVTKEPAKVETKTTKKPSDTRVPLKSLKPLSESEESKKPVSKVDPMPPKKAKKSVRFSDAPPQIVEFEIEPGNRLNKTSSIKTALVDTPRRMPTFSLEKLTLIKILRWNPHWLDEQINNNEPPPILGHNNIPLNIFHAFDNHHQYVGQVGDLLLMEIWECVTQGYMRVREQNTGISMKITSLPPPPPQERVYDLFNITVEIAVPRSETRNVPRMGEIMIVYFGPENAKNSRFLYVNNVQQPNNRRPCFTVNLHAIFTDKMRSMHPGEVMIGKSLAYVQKELTLFEAMEYLAGSPLSEAILRPEPQHFPEVAHHPECNMNSRWVKGLNDSQKAAISASVSAALGDRPRIQMVQGPPGTGKSAVITAMVMAYFYDPAERRLQNRGKILICATSNAAVDELVCRLLNIRQTLPKNERFRMVRVGRAEAMHPRARDVSSQQLAQRDARPRPDQQAPALKEEISRLTAKINMWKSASRDAKDPSRIAYCEERVKQFTLKRAQLGGSGDGGEEPRPEDVARAERRIIEYADIVLTTLASAINQKMRGLKRRIALCIVDEAGQAIEPEALIPLTLDVTRLTLIGDPQQLPGYICSQVTPSHSSSCSRR